MSGGFFRGTSADQDTRFSNKQAKLLKSQKFAPELDHLVDMTKVKMDVIRPWIANRVTELLGFEDEVLINFIYGLLDGKDVNGKQVQISLTGFMEKNTGKFMKELWSLLLSAQKNASGVPQQFLDAKEEETRKKKAESDRIANEIQKKKDKESREYEQERLNKMDNGDKQNAGDMELEPPSKNMLSKVSAACPEDERNADQRNGVRRKRVSRSPRSPDCSPSHRVSRSQSVSRSPSKSRSYSDDKRKFRSVSRSPQPRRRSISSDRKYNSQRRRSITPRSRRSRSPVGRRSSFSKRRSPSLSPRRSPSPIRHRVRSPYRRRSPVPVRRRSRSPVPVRRRSRSPVPVRRRSRSPIRRHRSPTPIRHHRSSSYRHRRSPSPVHRRRSPSPVPRRSPSRVHRILPSPKHHRSPSHKRRRSPSLKGHRSPPKHNRSSPKRRRSPSPSLRRSSTPKREHSHRSSSTPKHRSLSTPKHRSSSLDRHRSLASSHRSVTASPDESLSRSSLSPLQHRSSSPVRSPKGRRSPLLSPGERQRMQGKLSPVGRRPSAPRSSDSILMDQGDGGDKSPVYKSQSHVRNRSPSEDRRSSSPYENPMKQRRDHITRDCSFSPEHKRRELKGQWDSKGTSRKIDASRSRLSPPVSRKTVSPRKVHIPEGSAGGWSTDSQKQLDNVELRKNDVEMRSEKSSGKGTYDRQRSPAVSEDSFQCEKQTASQQREEKKSDRRGLSSQNNMDSDQYRKAETSPTVLDKVADSNHALDSGSEGSTKQRTKHKEKRKHKRSERHEVTSDDYSSYDSEVEGRKEAKRRRRKEEKKLRKEERRKRREERRRRREERHAEKLKVKGQDNSNSDEHETMRIPRLDDEEAETEQKKLEIELREKALESLKAKKGLSR